MKKIIFFMFMLVAPASFAQFTVTPNGVKSATDETKDFTVVEVPGKTAKELYAEVFKYIQKAYKNPEKVLKGQVEGEYISFVTFAPAVVQVKAGLSKATFNTEFTTTIEFKEGKMKISFAPIEWKMENTGGGKYNLHYQGGTFDGYIIYNKKGELKEADAKKQIEDYFNGFTAKLKDAVSGAAKKEEW